MSKLLIRHGLSDANNYELHGTPAFGNPQASLMPRGVEQATALGARLINEYSIDLDNEAVAVSMMLRTQETAVYAGFRNLTIYKELNEEKGGLSDEEVKKALLTWQSPEATKRAARLIIENPPPEKVWVLHAFLIGTICQELGIYTNAERFVPRFCETREAPL